MIFLFAIPVFHGGLGNLILPSALGLEKSRSPALSRLALLWHFLGATLLLTGMLIAGNRSGWIVSFESLQSANAGRAALILGRTSNGHLQWRGLALNLSDLFRGKAPAKAES
jgi:heme/copper-type cytochrome/quinol oxidase subunit 1